MGEKATERRYQHNYRFPPGFIDRWTKICVWTLIGGIAVGFGLAAAGGTLGDWADANDRPGWVIAASALLIVALVVGAGGFLFAIGVSAFLGGEALQRGGGWVGIVFVVGLLGTAIGAAFGAPLFIAGLVLLIGGAVGYVLMGLRAHVPMWLQLPIFGSPRLYVQGEPEDEGEPHGRHSGG